MAENPNDHRFARAAGRAVRSFRENREAERAAEGRRRTGQSGAGVRERTGRAAGEAARAFRENQAKDDARLGEVRAEVRTTDEERLARRRAERKRALEERDAAEAGLVHPLLRLARLWWLVVTGLLFTLAGAFAWYGSRAAAQGGDVVDPLTGVESVGPLGGATGQYLMAGVVAVLALTALWGWIGLMRRRRSAIGTLTFITVLCVVPAVLRMNPILLLLAGLLALGAVLVWLPPVRSRVRR